MTGLATAPATSTNQRLKSPLVSVVMPCLNEEEGLGGCIEIIQRVFEKHNINGEIVVCDNGSTDRSVEIAESMGVRVVHQPKRGYGNAYLKGFECAEGEILIMGDADATYDFNLIPEFVKKIVDEKYEFVTGSRYLGKGDKHITWLHRWVGNPMLTLMLNIMFGTKYTDVYCGFRGFSKKVYEAVQPVSPGMEFNLELAINASLAGVRIAEIPIVLAERKGVSKLHTFKDGWRSLRMMLLYCPNKVFLFPGLSLFLFGAFLHFIALSGMVHYHGRTLGASGGTSVMATVATVLGVQILSLGLHAKTYSWSRRFDGNRMLSVFYKYFTLEAGLTAGALSILSGIAITAAMVWHWFNTDFGPVTEPQYLCLGATLVLVGGNVMFTSLFISAMSMTRPNNGIE